MATISCNGTFQVSGVGGIDSVNIGINVTKTGDNTSKDTLNIPLSVWTPLYTGSLSDVRYFAADNISTGTIVIASGSAGQNMLAKLLPGDNHILPWSGSLSLYAQSYTSASVLAYVVTEA